MINHVKKPQCSPFSASCSFFEPSQAYLVRHSKKRTSSFSPLLSYPKYDRLEFPDSALFDFPSSYLSSGSHKFSSPLRFSSQINSTTACCSRLTLVSGSVRNPPPIVNRSPSFSESAFDFEDCSLSHFASRDPPPKSLRFPAMGVASTNVSCLSCLLITRSIPQTVGLSERLADEEEARTYPKFHQGIVRQQESYRMILFLMVCKDRWCMWYYENLRSYLQNSAPTLDPQVYSNPRILYPPQYDCSLGFQPPPQGKERQWWILSPCWPELVISS